MTTAAAENLARSGVEKKEERVEKRRALGRGLESLLPGPRVLPSVDSRLPSVERTGLPATTSLPPSTANVDGSQVEHFAVQRDSTLEKASSFATDASRAPHVATHIAPHPDPSPLRPQVPANNVVVNLAIDLIEKNPYQTRYVFDEAEMIELRDSIIEHGVVQPVVVRPVDEQGRYILVLGERRLRASKMAGKETIPALVRKLSPQQAAEMTVLENVMREDLNPIEQAEAYRVLSQEFNLTQAQIAQRIGVSRESVANYMRLLRLPEEIRQHVAHGRLGFSEARELLSLENPEHIPLVAEDLLLGRLRWDELRDRIARLNASLPPLPATDNQKENRAARWIDPNVRAAQMEMERLLGVRVKIKDRNGKGKIVIEYASVDDYERVIEMLRGERK